MLVLNRKWVWFVAGSRPIKIYIVEPLFLHYYCSMHFQRIALYNHKNFGGVASYTIVTTVAHLSYC